METKKLSFGRKVWNFVKGNPIVILLVLGAIVVGCFTDNFFSWVNFSNLASNTAVRFLIALGVSGCLITKGTDLSAGRQLGFAACLAGLLLQRPDYTGRMFDWLPSMYPNVPVWVWMALTLLIVVAVGALFGLLNGLSERPALHHDPRHADDHLWHFPDHHRRTADRRLPESLHRAGHGTYRQLHRLPASLPAVHCADFRAAVLVHL